ncbi:hypothetical protein [Microbacterium sp. UBA837]|jgi:hypothetical protein|uniref:hypothetical protein n=1 Tax=Microbacterium sp. UBA837 TaxID=1946956 RepID=UPI0025CE2455|nr:hypothetical protein [Microbacterium sp. UBA837]|tara:strand:- start:17956 stop:19047 length:1092 start_codon:yes stop_codon:yes gene_type:complete
MDPSGLEPILNVLTNVAMILSLVCVGVGLFCASFNSSRGYGGSMIAGGLVLGGTSFLLPHLVDTMGAAHEESEKNPAPEPAMPDIDWSTVGWVVAGVAGAAALLALIYVTATKARRAMARDAAESGRLDRIWKESVQRHDRLREQWMDFQHDIEKVLSFPLLSDVSEPKTSAFIEALGAAADLSATRRPKSAEAVERYAQATRTAETRWQAALHHAERVRLARFEPGERDRIKKVQRLLRQAKNGGASPEERRTYYERAREMLGDLIRLPEPARLALEQEVRGELEAPRPPAAWPTYATPAERLPEPTKRATSTSAAARRESERQALDADQSQSMLWATYGLTTGTDLGAGCGDVVDPGSGCS